MGDAAAPVAGPASSSSGAVVPAPAAIELVTPGAPPAVLLAGDGGELEGGAGTGAGDEEAGLDDEAGELGAGEGGAADEGGGRGADDDGGDADVGGAGAGEEGGGEAELGRGDELGGGGLTEELARELKGRLELDAGLDDTLELAEEVALELAEGLVLEVAGPSSSSSPAPSSPSSPLDGGEPVGGDSPGSCLVVSVAPVLLRTG